MKQSGIGRSVATAAVLGCSSAALPAAAIEVRVEDDYAAVIVEAEEFDTIDERWVLTAPDTPQQDDDPDGNHSDQAVGSRYLELLPDYRTTHSSPEGPLPSFWGPPGTGPSASYTVDFPEAGRYHVHARAFTTGSEDNGIHFGLDDEWPASGARWQICAAGDDAWRWSSQQRDSGGNVCGVRKTVWLDVEEPGEHTVRISAREDGFELDRFVLLKDRSDNTRTCEPVRTEAERIVCWDGGIDQPDDFVDLAVTLGSERDEGEVGERFDVVATIGNRDTHDTARDVELAFAFDAESWNVVDSDARCAPSETGVLCAFDELLPYAPDETITLTLEAIAGGTLAIELASAAAQGDDEADNDAARLDMLIDAPAPEPTRLVARLGELPDEVAPEEPVTLSFGVDNVGGAVALDTRVALALPEELVSGELPGECERTTTRLLCTVGTLAPSASKDYVVTLSGTAPGGYAIGSSASAGNADDAEVEATLTLRDASGGETGGQTGGGTGDGGSAGQTTGSDGAVARDGGGSGAGGPLALLGLLGALASRRLRRGARRADGAA